MLHMPLVEPVAQSSTLEKPTIRPPCDSCLHLSSKISDIAIEIESLVSERDLLLSSLADLKQILVRIAKENAGTAAEHLAVNVSRRQKALKEKLEKSRLSIKTAEKCSGHYSRMVAYWSQLN